MPALTGKQRTYLRGLGHARAAVLHVGKEGVTEALLAELASQLEIHELVKIAIGRNAPDERHALAEDLARGANAELVQVLGRMALVYRPRKEKPAIKLPAGRPKTA